MTLYPNSIDGDSNLYLARDFLRVTLTADYNPGDTSISVNSTVNFPPTGIITLTDQCNDLPLRALSLYYTSFTVNSFNGLSVVEGFTDVMKPALRTDITLNVIAPMHNSIKDALLAIESFAGKQGQIALTPLTGTMEQRINYLRQLVLKPVAWFSPSNTIGIVPLAVTFNDLTVRQADNWLWNFGDGNQQTVTGVLVGTVTHTYTSPGTYSPSLTVTNEFGSNELQVAQMITARAQAPDVATLDWFPSTGQTFINGVFHSTINQLISVSVATNGEQPMDPIKDYQWFFGDDLTHANSSNAIAMYSIGGIYDTKLRIDTILGAYRISDFPSSINITESVNLWMFLFDSPITDTSITKNVSGFEFGLISETFKVGSRVTQSVTRNYNFLNGTSLQSQQVQEFRRNNGFCPRSLISSGNDGTAILYWAEGGAVPTDAQSIRFREYDAFDDVWITPSVAGAGDSILRRWNWVSLNSPSVIYFHLGQVDPPEPTGSPTNQNFTGINLTDLSSIGTTAFGDSNYLNGASELMNNVGGGMEGDFSVYRAVWQNNTGYIIRNDGAGVYFRLKSFYSTVGILSNPVQSIIKLSDMPGNTKLDGELVALSQGLYFFNNSGEVVVYNPTTNTWAVGGPGVGSTAFTTLQDTTVPGFDSASQPLLAASDGDQTAFISYDYSSNAFIRFNEADLTFVSLPPRFPGEQFMMGVF